MGLSARHRQFLTIDQCAIPTAINLVANGLICYLLNRSVTLFPLWGASSVAVDLLATAFLLPFLLCVISSKSVAKMATSGKLPPIPLAQYPLDIFRLSPLKRGLGLGAAGIIFAGAPILMALSLGGSQGFALMPYVIFKGVWAALVAAVVSPLVGWWALADESHKQLTAGNRSYQRAHQNV
ncbi:MAG: hypothetical protein AAFY72_10720 [Cyanobacteria bacterium J06649_4]